MFGNLKQEQHCFIFAKNNFYEVPDATRNGAKLVGSDEFGAILPGKLADLAAIDRNPLEDITCTKNICLVMKEGNIVRTVWNLSAMAFDKASRIIHVLSLFNQLPL